MAAIVLLTMGLGVIVYFVLPSRGVKQVVMAPDSSAVAPAKAAAPAAPTAATPADSQENEIEPRDTSLRPGDIHPGAATTQLASGASELTGIGAADKFASANRNGSVDAKAAAGASIDVCQKRVACRAERCRLGQGRGADDSRGPPERRSWATGNGYLRQPRLKEALMAAAPSDPAARPRDGMVMVVRPSDTSEIQKELSAYFASKKIDFQPAPPPVTMALNLSLAERDASGTSQWRKRAEEKRENQESAPTGEPSAGAGRGDGANLPTDRLSRKPAAGMAAGAVKDAAPNALLDAPAPGNDRRSARQFAGDESAKAFSAGLADADQAASRRVYVARQLSAEQMRDLREYLGRHGEVSQAAVEGASPGASANAMAVQSDASRMAAPRGAAPCKPTS